MTGMLQRLADAEQKRMTAIREEITRNGIWWAAEEIDRLRRQVTHFATALSAPQKGDEG